MAFRTRWLASVGLAAVIAACGQAAELSSQLEAASQNAASAGAAVSSVTEATTTVNSTVETVETVTELSSTVQEISETSTSLQSVSTSGTSTSDSSLLGGIRGAAPRPATTTEPARKTEPPKYELCAQTGTTLPCYCVMHSPDKFPLDTDSKCVEKPPAAEGSTAEATPVTATVNVSKVDDGIYHVVFTATVPAKTRVPEDVKKACTASGDKLTCKRELTLVKRCKPDAPDQCFYVPAPEAEKGTVVFLDRRFDLTAEVSEPPDFNDRAAVEAWLETIAKTFEDAKNEGELRALVKRFLVEAPGWVTEIKPVKCDMDAKARENKECPRMEIDYQEGPHGGIPMHPVKVRGLRVFSHEVPPPVLPGDKPLVELPRPRGYAAEFRKSHVEGKMPTPSGEGKGVKTVVFSMNLEKLPANTADMACTPADLDSIPLSGAPEGFTIVVRRVELEKHGGYGFGGGKVCRSSSKQAVQEGVAPTPPTNYSSERHDITRQLPEPQAEKRPPLYPVQEKVDEQHYIIVQPLEKILQVEKELKDLKDQKDKTDRKGKDGMKDGMGQGKDMAVETVEALKTCPGTGEGIRHVVVSLSDGTTKERTHRWVKEEGECHPRPLDENGNPIEVAETAEGTLETKVKDKAGRELPVKVENATETNKTVTIDAAGFVKGSISFHEADEDGIVAEGTLSVTVPGAGSVEVTMELSAAGWQHVRGKAETKDGKTVAFWQDRTAAGADIQFRLIASKSASVTVAEEAEAQTGTVEASGEMSLTTASDSSNACEVVGSGTMTINSGDEKGTTLSLTIYEDKTTKVTSDGTVANEPLEGCAAGKTPSTTTASTATGTAGS
ncbi:MAG: hypothetical protein HYY13_01030 [Nitrospirae bacterium]|nr:hypothetical protein [Nitrospirota bacterium]